MTTIAREVEDDQIEVTVGVDTHGDTHTAAVIDTTGRLLGCQQFPADMTGYAALLSWAVAFGVVLLAAIEGTGAYGAGLARYLRGAGVDLLEIDRPDRKARRFAGKSDPLDAEAAARAGLARVRTGVPKDRTGKVEALRNLRVARRSAVDQRADCTRRIKTLLVTAPDELRERLRHLSDRELLCTCAALRPDTARAGEPEQATKIALRALARRHASLVEEIVELDAIIEPLVTAINPALLELNGVGADVAGQLLVTAGENVDRLRSEAAFAMLCGAAPIPASSGKTHRHRLNRGGDRQANAALYRIVLCRLRWDPRTQAYARRRTEEGLTKKDIIRCLKRLIAREIYYTLIRT
ncbi:IS110 family transposase [Microbacterium sp. YJN-G]|uniref:IS110 family transposase n=1 Tax=Microbacterium sp. YJN-G TaxID=2763257 RepID=UPI00187799D3|nr:IS110 family transposase [Microbacterium sp. YJN-G]